MCKYIYIYMYVCMSINALLHACIFVVYVRSCLALDVLVFMFTFIGMFVVCVLSVSICMHTYIYIDICTYLYACITILTCSGIPGFMCTFTFMFRFIFILSHICISTENCIDICT